MRFYRHAPYRVTRCAMQASYPSQFISVTCDLKFLSCRARHFALAMENADTIYERPKKPPVRVYGSSDILVATALWSDRRNVAAFKISSVGNRRPCRIVGLAVRHRHVHVDASRVGWVGCLRNNSIGHITTLPPFRGRRWCPFVFAAVSGSRWPTDVIRRRL
jgi:hypothetical protein